MKYVVLPLMFWVMGFVTSCSIATAQPLREPPPAEPVEDIPGKSFVQGGNDKLLISVTAVGIPNTLQYVRAESTLPIKHFDVIVFSGGNFIEAIETKNKGEFVFTGPVGRYTIRVTAYDTELGFISRTQTMEIRGIGPVDPVLPTPDPIEPTVPVDPGSPATGPPPEGKWGTAPIMYYALVKFRPSPKAVDELYKIYEWAATTDLGVNKSVPEVKIRLDNAIKTYPELANVVAAWRTEVKRLAENGVLLPDQTEHRELHKETMAGIKAAYGN